MQSIQHVRKQFGDYKILHLLGRGGFTEVYLGRHIRSGQLAAIKLLDARQAGYELEKFFARASVLSHLHHPHIIQVYDSGIIEDTAYLVMTYAPGGTMRTRYPKGTRLPLEMVTEYVKQVAGALEHVHMHQLIHRDIKPQNMLLNEQDQILLSDFGIAVVSPSIDPLQPDFYDFEGTVIYASPEQLQGKPRRSSDQYAFGVVLYEWLAGCWPFVGTFDQIVQQHLFDPPPSFEQKGVSIAPAIEQVIRRALEKEPTDRFPTIQHFAQAFAEAVETSKGTLPTKPISTSRIQFKSPLPFPRPQ